MPRDMKLMQLSVRITLEMSMGTVGRMPGRMFRPRYFVAMRQLLEPLVLAAAM